MYVIICTDKDGLKSIVYDETGRDPFLTDKIEQAVSRRNDCEKFYSHYEEEPKYEIFQLTKVSHEPVCNPDRNNG